MVQGIKGPSDEFIVPMVRARLRPTQGVHDMRRFYTKQHRFHCGIDLHARLLAICIVDHETASVVCRVQIPADKQLLLDTLAPYRADVVVAVECLFAWYWVADLCNPRGVRSSCTA